jgi:hypothetical protein
VVVQLYDVNNLFLHFFNLFFQKRTVNYSIYVLNALPTLNEFNEDLLIQWRTINKFSIMYPLFANFFGINCLNLLLQSLIHYEKER